MLTIEFEKLPTYRMGWDKGRQEGQDEGREEGREEGKREGIDEEKNSIARKLLDMGFETMQVSSVTSLPVVEIERLRIGKAE